MGGDEVIDDITVLVAALTNIESRSATSGSQRSSFERLSQGSNGSLESVDENREIP